MYDFDTVVERAGTGAAKWDTPLAAYGAGIIPLSVADMDFPAPPAVVDAVAARARHGIYGYTDLPADYFPAVADWLAGRHGWHTDPGLFVHVQRIVEAVPLLLRAETAPGDGVLVHTPYYAPTASAVGLNGRRLVESPLRYDSGRGRYEMDFAHMERAVRTEGVRALLLCSPHNPTGRVWERAELERLAELALRHDLLVISDDVYADFTGFAAPGTDRGRRHTFLASLGADIAAATVTCVSPNKTFNLAGLEISNLHVPDPLRRERLTAAMRAAGMLNPAFFAATATLAAYREGAPWLDALLAHLDGNLALLRGTLAARMPGLRLVEPDGTCLAWLDCRDWAGADDARLTELTARRARVAVSAGGSFGAGYAGYARLNLATPRPLLDEALDRLARTYGETAGTSQGAAAARATGPLTAAG
ncbi:MalY/PatB family protein [Streptomyces sp. NPDC004111]|uniref:MalY/PatB family protein n=1 Tax=Streptomyces sp. NPDC004111 TaxID=3364690 RepID=UPI003690F4AF